MSKEAPAKGMIALLSCQADTENRLITKRKRWLAEIGTGEIKPDSWENAVRVGDTKKHVEASIDLHLKRMAKVNQRQLRYQRAQEIITKQAQLAQIHTHVEHKRLSPDVGARFQAEWDRLQEEMHHDRALGIAVKILLAQQRPVEPEGAPQSETQPRQLLKLVKTHSADNPLTLDEIRSHFPGLTADEVATLMDDINSELRRNVARVCSVQHIRRQEATYYYELVRPPFRCKLKDAGLKSDQGTLSLPPELRDLVEFIAWGGVSGHRPYSDIRTKLDPHAQDDEQVIQMVTELKGLVSGFFGLPDIVVSGGNDETGRWVKLKDTEIHVIRSIDPEKLEAFLLLLSKGTPINEIVAALGNTKGKTGRKFAKQTAAKAMQGVRNRLEKNGSFAELDTDQERKAWNKLLLFKAENNLTGPQMDEYISDRFGVKHSVPGVKNPNRQQ